MDDIENTCCVEPSYALDSGCVEPVDILDVVYDEKKVFKFSIMKEEDCFSEKILGNMYYKFNFHIFFCGLNSQTLRSFYHTYCVE